MPLDLSELHSAIQQTLEIKSDGFETDEIIKYLEKKDYEKFSGLAVSNLHKIVVSSQQLYLLDKAKKRVEQILTFAIKADEDSKTKAIEIINA